jgi:hypothetical protein
MAHMRAAARGQLRLAVVQVEPGIVKTRLLQEARRRLAQEGFSVLCGRGEELAKHRRGTPPRRSTPSASRRCFTDSPTTSETMGL